MIDEISRYLHRRTLIAGDVNAGKTTRTVSILDLFLEAGLGERTAILDLAPDPIRGVGGKLPHPSDASLLYLTDRIAAPRMMGSDTEHTRRLARDNARTIEVLFRQLKENPREILFINDATLYLQAGRPSLLYETLASSTTQVINAYYGSAFEDSELTRRERALTEALMESCDEVILI